LTVTWEWQCAVPAKDGPGHTGRDPWASAAAENRSVATVNRMTILSPGKLATTPKWLKSSVILMLKPAAFNKRKP